MFESIFVLIICIVAPLALVGFIIGAVLYYKHSREAMWHETARLALEKGQPLPAPPGAEEPAPLQIKTTHGDIRAGLILIGVGAGLAIFFKCIGLRDGMGIGAIPGFIGVALLLFGLFTRKPSPPENPPPQS